MLQRSPTQTQPSSFTPVQTGGLLQHKCASCGQHTAASGLCSECQKKRSPLQRRAANSTEVDEVPPIVHEVLRSSGQPLDTNTRAFMESRFKQDFSQVRVHTDTKAAESARAVNAIAYTVRQDVVFGAGQYAPDTVGGQQLLGHELTHVVQQQNLPPSSRLKISEEIHPLEQEANATATELSQNSPQRVAPVTTSSLLLRQPAEQLRPLLPRSSPPVRTAPSLRVIEGGLSRATARSAERTGWRYFWRAVIRRFGLRAAIAAALAAADGPLPIGELIDIGLALWTIWEIVQLWDVIWTEASQIQVQEQRAPESQPQPQPEEERNSRQRCLEANPRFQICGDVRMREDVVTSFANSRGIEVASLNCEGRGSLDSISDCNSGPGENWHCTVNDSEFVVSLFGCFCCQEDGSVGFEWHPHQSPGVERGASGTTKRQPSRRERLDQRQRDRQRWERRRGDDSED